MQIDDEVQMQRLVYAIVKAFNGDKTQSQKPAKQETDEEVIDTTDPEFAKHFQGFTYAKSQSRSPRPRSTEILFG